MAAEPLIVEGQTELWLEPDLEGHENFCPVMCDLWADFYRPTDPATLNLAQFKAYPTPNCRVCKLELIPEPERSRVKAILREMAA